ncbi:ferredoxin [Proteinivorax tanatarense]|uniref:Ferredoxin n=1 Tax=Proteinivorax tanatarense TaxID=1260629 RepID=A0AAU7VL91_9FIRM
MKAIVDQEACIGCGLCPNICPEVYEMTDDDEKAIAIDEEIPEDKVDSAKEAADACPTDAIKVS